MSLVKVNWRPSPKELRDFGRIALIASALIALLLYLLKGLAIHWALIIFAGGFIIFLASVISRELARMIYLGLIMATLPIGLVVSFILLASFFYLLITPLGLFFRLIGRDPLGRKFDPGSKSYWLAHRRPENLERYFHQF